MAQRTNADMGLVDGMTSDLGGPRTAALLGRLDAAVPWDALARPIEALPEYHGPVRGEQSKGGRPAWPARTMLRCVILAKWFGLGDAQLEEGLKDRLSFRRFAGLSLTDATPDETTFVVFRRRLREAGLDRRIFEETVAQLERRGLLVKDGTLVERVYPMEGLNLRRNRPRRRKSVVTRGPSAAPTRRDERWSMDFIHDQLRDGRGLRVLTVLDHYTREALATEARGRFSAHDVIDVLNRL